MFSKCVRELDEGHLINMHVLVSSFSREVFCRGESGVMWAGRERSNERAGFNLLNMTTR